MNFQLGGDQKQELKDYVEESGKFSSLSGLIRASVSKEMNGTDEF